MGMIPGTFIVVEDTQQAKDNQALDTQTAEIKQPEAESDQQRLIRQFQEKWQQILAYFQNLANQ